MFLWVNFTLFLTSSVLDLESTQKCFANATMGGNKWQGTVLGGIALGTVVGTLKGNIGLGATLGIACTSSAIALDYLDTGAPWFVPKTERNLARWDVGGK